VPNDGIRVPIRGSRDDKGIAVSSNMIYYAAISESLIAGHTYYLCPLGEALKGEVAIKPGTVYFALAVPQDGWLDPDSKKGDYVLVQWKPSVAQEGPGVLWTGEQWVGGQFVRDADTGNIRFVEPRPRIIGDTRIIGDIGQERGYVVALLKPRPPFVPILILNEKYRFPVRVLQNTPGSLTRESVQLPATAKHCQLPAIVELSEPHAMAEPGQLSAIAELPPDIDVAIVDVTVRVQGMEILPRWIQSIEFSRWWDPDPLEFELVPREAGHKQIEVDFYHHRRWLRHISFHTVVVASYE
jgi:hypothetical protein